MSHTYDKNHPFLATLTSRYPLTKPGSHKNTQHLELSLVHSNIHYKVGDSVGVWPQNDPRTVQEILTLLKAKGDEEVVHPRTNQPLLLRDFLIREANLTAVTKKLLTLLSSKHAALQRLLQPEQQMHLNSWIETHHIWDTLHEYRTSLSPQEFVATLSPMLPRFYSLASSQLVVGPQADFTVILTEYLSNGHLRRGVASHYLIDLAPLHEKVIPIYLHPSKDFTLPSDENAPIIMIGPGTGVAPFRGFMQERFAKNAPGKNWLFFGEWTRAHEYLYEEFWTALAQAHKLKLSLAFSRDQPQKIYVQHLMLEQGKELWDWLQEGAYLYVCGNATHMAKDVDAALHTIAQTIGGLSPDNAKAYLKELRQQKRYLRDVY